MNNTLPDNLLTYEAASKYLGITDRTLRTWVRKGRIRAIRMGPRSIRFDPADLSMFLDHAKTPATEDCPN